MLFGTWPGETPAQTSPLFAMTPPYGALIAQYLDRLGPYRLQRYAPPPMPQIALPVVPGAPTGPGIGEHTAAARRRARPTYLEQHDGPDRRAVSPTDPVGAGPGVLTGYDRVLGVLDGIANPLGLAMGFSNPSLGGLAALGIGSAVGAARQGVVDKLNSARLEGLINDANMRARPGMPLGRAGGVGTPGVGGGFARAPGASGGGVKGLGNGRAGQPSNAGAQSRRGPDGRGAKGRDSNRGPGGRGDGFGHFGGPR